MVSKRKDF